jgi:pyruvate/2-oxoglutarate/acetoin dehydrogenase E1 component
VPVAVAADEGRRQDVVDLRSIVPFDEETVMAEVRRTGRAVLVAEAPGLASVSSESSPGSVNGASTSSKPRCST